MKSFEILKRCTKAKPFSGKKKIRPLIPVVELPRDLQPSYINMWESCMSSPSFISFSLPNKI